MSLPPDVRATDILANERTFLAWVRTSLAFIAFGFVIARFSLFTREIAAITKIAESGQHYSTVFGVAMEIAGIAVGIYGAWRYTAQNRALHNGTNLAMPSIVATLGAIALAIVGTIVAVDLLALH